MKYEDVKIGMRVKLIKAPNVVNAVTGVVVEKDDTQKPFMGLDGEMLHLTVRLDPDDKTTVPSFNKSAWVQPDDIVETDEIVTKVQLTPNGEMMKALMEAMAGVPSPDDTPEVLLPSAQIRAEQEEHSWPIRGKEKEVFGTPVTTYEGDPDMAGMGEVRLTHNGFSSYVAFEDIETHGKKRRAFFHTQTDMGARRHHMADFVVRHAIAEALKEGREPLPLCPFVHYIMSRTDGWKEIVERQVTEAKAIRDAKGPSGLMALEPQPHILN